MPPRSRRRFGESSIRYSGLQSSRSSNTCILEPYIPDGRSTDNADHELVFTRSNPVRFLDWEVDMGEVGSWILITISNDTHADVLANSKECPAISGLFAKIDVLLWCSRSYIQNLEDPLGDLPLLEQEETTYLPAPNAAFQQAKSDMVDHMRTLTPSQLELLQRVGVLTVIKSTDEKRLRMYEELFLRQFRKLKERIKLRSFLHVLPQNQGATASAVDVERTTESTLSNPTTESSEVPRGVPANKNSKSTRKRRAQKNKNSCGVHHGSCNDPEIQCALDTSITDKKSSSDCTESAEVSLTIGAEEELEIETEAERLRREKGELVEQTLCRICMDRKRDTLLLPCSHFFFCGSCVDAWQESSANSVAEATCPICSTKIEGRHLVYH